MAGARNFGEPGRIDYRKLSAALDHYESRGYEYIEAPWVVTREALSVTLPEGATATSVQYGDLVGSGEQSFIELMMRGRSVLKACCITPCFRIEPRFDELHHAYFMKMELIDTDATEANLHAMISDAEEFFAGYLEVEVEETGQDMYDIVSANRRIELGSYGYRAFAQHRFIYGTGVALPRFDTALASASEA